MSINALVRESVTAPSASFTRPADTTAYASGDLVANSVTAGSVEPLSFTAFRQGRGGVIRRVRLLKSGTTATNGQFRVHFYTASPVPANGDNGAWSTSKAANYLGSIDVTVIAFTDGCEGPGSAAVNAEIRIADATDVALYCLIEARAAYTPASAEVFTLTPEIIAN